MTTLQPDELPAFLERFQNFYDAVLRDFSCQPPNKERNETWCAISFEAKDMEVESGWSVVTIHLQKLTAWKFAMSLNCAYYILSGGVHLLYRDGLFYMDVNGLFDSPGKPDDYLASEFYFLASAICWEAVEIL